MDKQWMKSIIQLQDLISERTSLSRTPEATEHLQCLIECIEELCASRQQVKDELEAASIKAHSLNHRYTVLKKTAEKDEVRFRDLAIKQNEDFILNTRRRTVDMKKEINLIDEKTEEVERANENLKEVAKEQKDRAEKLSGIIGETIHNKARSIVNIKQNRCRAMDTQERVHDLAAMAIEIRLDVEYYAAYCATQVKGVKARAKKWKKKIDRSNMEGKLAKACYDQYDEKVNSTQIKINFLKRSIGKEEDKYKGYLCAVDKNDRNLKLRKRDLVMEQQAVENVKEVINQTHKLFKEKAAEHIEKKERIANDLEAQIIWHERKEKKKISLANKLQEKQKFLDSVRGEMKQQRREILDTAVEMDKGMSRLVSTRADRMRLKEKLMTVADTIENMEKVYAMEFERARAHLEAEIAHRAKTATECDAANRAFSEFIKEVKQHRSTSADMMQKCRFESARHASLEKRLSLETFEGKRRWSEVREEIKKNKIKLEIMKRESEEHIAKRQADMAAKEKEINRLKTIWEELEPQYLKKEEEYENFERRYVIFFHEYTQRHLVHSQATINLTVCRNQVAVMLKTCQQSAIDLTDIRQRVIEQLKRFRLELRESGLEICDLMREYERVSEENDYIDDRCDDVEEYVELNKDELEFNQKYLVKVKETLLAVRESLLNTITHEAEITNQFVLNNQTDLKNLCYVKNFVARRKQKTLLIAGRLSGVVDDVEVHVVPGQKKRRRSKKQSLENEESEVHRKVSLEKDKTKKKKKPARKYKSAGGLNVVKRKTPNDAESISADAFPVKLKRNSAGEDFAFRHVSEENSNNLKTTESALIWRNITKNESFFGLSIASTGVGPGSITFDSTTYVEQHANPSQVQDQGQERKSSTDTNDNYVDNTLASKNTEKLLRNNEVSPQSQKKVANA